MPLRRFFRRFSFLLCALCLAVPAQAQERRWQPAGFGGAGNFLTLAVDPERPGRVYATSDVAGVFRSDDGGERWRFAGAGLGNYEVSSLAIDPLAPDTLYAGVGAFAGSDKAGLYRSDDGGESWRHLAETAARRITYRVHRTPHAIAPSPHEAGVVLTGSRAAGIWRSADRGESWQQVLEPPRSDAPLPFPVAGSIVDDAEPPYAAPVTAVVHDPARPGRVYAAFYGVGVAISGEGGARGSWRWLSEGLPEPAFLMDLAVARDGDLYAAAGPQGVFRNPGGEGDWARASGGLPLEDFRVFSLAADPEAAERLYLTQEPDHEADEQHPPVWITTDGGASWRAGGETTPNLAVNPTEVWRYRPSEAWRVVVDPHDPTRLWFTEPWGLYRSEDAGGSWEAVVAGAQNTCVTDLLIEAAEGAPAGYRIFAAHMDAGLLASDDGGARWRPLLPRIQAHYRPLAGHAWRVLRPGPGSPLLAALAPWHSEDSLLLARKQRGGDVWETLYDQKRLKAGRGDGRLLVAADPNDPERLLLAQDGGRIAISEEGGRSWRLTPTRPEPDRINDVLIDGQGRLLVAGYNGGLWLSGDDGETWQRALPAVDRVWDLSYGSAGVLAAAGDGYAYRSDDPAGRWQRLKLPPPGRDADGTGDEGLAVLADPADPDHLVFARVDHWHYADNGGGVFESRDGGRSWEAINEGLGQRRVQAFAFAPDGTLYAGTWCGGLWRLSPDQSRS